MRGRGVACSGGHAGYEIAPFIPSLESLVVAALRAADPRVDLAGLLNTVQHHDMHHRWPSWLLHRTLLFVSASGADGYQSGIACMQGITAGLWMCKQPTARLGRDAEGRSGWRRFPTKHFSLYFTHWDRWCGTEHPDYSAKVRMRG